MKKIFIYTTLLATIIACNKLDNEPLQKADDPESNVKKITETVIGGPESSSKATIAADAKFAWTVGDNIAVHVTDGATPKYVFTSDAGASGASASAASASFTVAYDDGYSRDAFAVFPSTIISNCATANTNYGQAEHTLDVTLPGSYTLDQVSGNASPCPMIATNTAGIGWTFYHICGMLRLTMNSIPPSTKRLELNFNDKKVCGDFSIASPNPGSSVIATVATVGNDDIIKITYNGDADKQLNGNTSGGAWLDDLVLNIPIPTGEYTNITITAYDATTGGNAILTMTRGFSYTAKRAKGTRKTECFPVFSIGGSTRVIFSSGNLVKTDNTYAVGSGNETYEFEAVPFNTSGGSLGYGSTPSSTSARGYFTWNEACSIGTITLNSLSWRVMSSGEWSYLMESPAHRTMKYGIAKWYLVKGTINGLTNKYGALIPPDCATTTDVGGLTSGTVLNTDVDIDSYIAKGFIFLPSEGCRYGSSWIYTNDEGYYWSTTSSDSTYGVVWCFDLQSSVITCSYNILRKTYYCSVRLVHVIQ